MFIRKITTSKGTRDMLVSSLEGIFYKNKQNAHLLDALLKENPKDNPKVVSEVKEVLDAHCKKKPK